MLSSSQRLAARVHRRGTLGWLALLSLALHLTLFLSFLMFPTMQPPTSASEPISVDVVMDDGPAEAAAAPIAPAAPAQNAETPPPAPAPEAPPSPVQQAETPPSAPAPVPEAPPPVQNAETPPPTPAPAPIPVPPPPRPAAQAHPPPAPPSRAAARPAAARVPVNPAGVPAHATDGQNAPSRASNGAAWTGKLKQWWDQHSFYPKEASQANEGGNVKVHIVIAADGQVTLIDVVQGSGSSVLDAAAVAVFRNARLPPFPPGTPAQPADVVVTLHYRSADNGG